MQLRDYTFLGGTQSLCPDCLEVVPAKIIERAGRVYFRKRCPEHGTREDFVCSDVKWFDRHEFSVPGRIPPVMGVEPRRGCPYDCGLCTEHEQHTCIGLLEITSSCNLTCPMCFAGSAPGGTHLTLEECKAAIDRLVEVEGRAEVLQLSGGEPTIHPQFLDVLDYACGHEIDVVMINTNAIRFARDEAFVEAVAALRDRLEVYFQLDAVSPADSANMREDPVHLALRGEPLLETKLKALERLREAGIRVTLVATLQSGLNEDQIGPLVDFALTQPHITGVSFQPATYSGRYYLPEELAGRVTFPDVIKGVAATASFAESDFLPLPCAHPNAHALAYAYREGETAIPLTQFINAAEHIDLLAGGITFNRQRGRELVQEVISRQCGCGGDCATVPASNNESAQELYSISASGNSMIGPAGEKKKPADSIKPQLPQLAERFFRRAIAEDLSPTDVFRITITSFMDAYNFDIRQLMKSCVHHVLPSGHLIPFSAYNVLYRDGHVPLPPLDRPAKRKGTPRPLIAAAH